MSSPFALFSLDRCFSELVPSVCSADMVTKRAELKNGAEVAERHVALYPWQASFASAAANGDRLYQRWVREIHRLNREHPSQEAKWFLEMSRVP